MKPQICTTVEQSKELSKILPLESADMHYLHTEFQHQKVDILKLGPAFAGDKSETSAWSLSTLLEFLPYELVDEEGISYFFNFSKEDDNYHIWYEDRESEFYFEHDSESFVTACYEMIIKLKEKNVL